jgi:exosortase/archaeosortase family protein
MLGQQALRIAPLSRLRLAAPAGPWAPIVLAVLTYLAFWRSFASVWPLLGVESPAGLTPLVPLAVTWLACAAVRHRQRRGLAIRGPADEAIIDIPVGAALAGVAAWLLWYAPDQYGWYYWTYRLDLLAIPFFVLSAAVLLWGFQTVLFYKGVAAALFLIWPEPLLRLQTAVAPVLAVFSAQLARPIASALGAHLAPVGAVPRVFSGSGPNPFQLLVADVCSSSSASFVVPLITTPAALQFGIPWRKALPWMAAGIALMLVGNVARIAALVLSADRLGVNVAMGTVHPVAGMVVLAVVFFLLWLFTPHAPAEAAAAVPAVVRPVFATVPVRSALIAVALAALFAAASTRLGAFEELPAVGPPGGAVAQPFDYFKLPPGWEIVESGELATQHLFGPGSSAYWINVRSADGTYILGQLVTTPNRSRLQAYSLERCRVYHGSDVVAKKTFSLGAGGLATIVDTWAQRGKANSARMSVLYWEAPFVSAGKEMHARVALFLPERHEQRVATSAVAGIAAGGAEFDKANTVLLDLARGMSKEILGSARTVPAA